MHKAWAEKLLAKFCIFLKRHNNTPEGLQTERNFASKYFPTRCQLIFLKVKQTQVTFHGEKLIFTYSWKQIRIIGATGDGRYQMKLCKEGHQLCFCSICFTFSNWCASLQCVLQCWWKETNTISNWKKYTLQFGQIYFLELVCGFAVSTAVGKRSNLLPGCTCTSRLELLLKHTLSRNTLWKIHFSKSTLKK